MVISSLNTGRILDLLRLMEHYLAEMKPFSRMPLVEFLADKKNPPFVESYLRRSLEAMFDSGRHILAKMYGSRGIEYKAIAKELGEKGVVTKDLSDTLMKMAGYRNRMVHFYREITPEELLAIVTQNLGDFDLFIREISAFIKEYEGKEP